LTVRESSAKWKTSLTKFMEQETKRFGNPWYYILTRFNDMGLTGPNFMAMSKIGEKYVLEKILPGSDPKKRFFTWQENIKYIQQFYDAAEEAYLKHNEHVKATVDPDRLLVWDVKDGWEPLCNFLGKPVPADPIPHDNKTGDTAYIENLMMQTKYWKDAMSFLKCNCLLLLIMIALIVGVIILFCVIYGIIS